MQVWQDQIYIELDEAVHLITSALMYMCIIFLCKLTTDTVFVNWFSDLLLDIHIGQYLYIGYIIKNKYTVYEILIFSSNP